ncbi:GNAT family N-acetyltransferase [Candidatus Peregrinibacteria bacterium]|jgi:[ribosomal protein S5]-alanine N-acetyltransferase|nr:GNAT family N-acetyltransferase [Candidatus Peregrinibacteria bacterium]
MSEILIKTDRLILRGITLDDFDAIHEYATDMEVVRHIEWGPNSVEDTNKFIADQMANQKDPKRKQFVFATTLDGMLIGTVGITIEGQVGDFGYAFNSKYWGNGYATEASKALLDYILDNFELSKLKATCDVKNEASCRVIEKCGLKLVKKVDNECEIRGEMRDTYFFERDLS